MKNQNNIKIISYLLILLAIISTSFATAGLNVILSSQNPDPVTPGNYVYVNIKVSNSGEVATKGTTISVIENENFKIAKGEPKIKNLGPIAANSRGPLGYEEGFDIAKFRLYVDEKTPLGLNTLEFKITELGREYNYDVEILVQDKNPKIQVNSLEVEQLEPGKSSQLLIEIENINSVRLQDIFVTLDLEEVESEVLSILKGSNQKVISILEPNEKKIIKFELVATPNADAKPYLLPITLEFEDSLNNNYSNNIVGSIEVYSKPLLSVKIDSQNSYQKGNNKISFAVANPGTSTIKGVQVEVISTDSYEVLEGSNHYIGDLNPDDFQTIQSTLFISNLENKNTKLKIKYLDSYNNEKEEIIELPMKLFTKEELDKYGLSKESNSNFSFTTLILILIVGFGAFWYGGRRAKKKFKK